VAGIEHEPERPRLKIRHMGQLGHGHTQVVASNAHLRKEGAQIRRGLSESISIVVADLPGPSNPELALARARRTI
jgi:hypothetical protein